MVSNSLIMNESLISALGIAQQSLNKDFVFLLTLLAISFRPNEGDVSGSPSRREPLF